MPILPRNEKTPLGIYIHIPFCRSKCAYCDFCSEVCADQKRMDDCLTAICAHIRETGPLTPAYRVDTVYFGGGTPSYFGAEGLAAILTAVRQSFDVSPQAEITFEANPDSVTPRFLRRLKSEGFNRVSLGIQSDDDGLLQQLGRPHTYEQAVEAVRMIRKAGYRNLSLDLIFALPGQTLAKWQDTLSNVLRLAPEHMSCYGLELHPGTPLHSYRTHIDFPGSDTYADMYLAAVELLRTKGYRQYEISNFAKRGYHSRHNMKYWMGQEYLGFGPSASSDFGGKRFRMVTDIDAYVTGIRTHGKVIEELQEIPLRERAGEYVMERMRTTHGIERQEYERQYLLPFDPLEEVLEFNRKLYLTIFSDGRWRFSPEGFLVSDTILSDLLLAQERSTPLAKRR